MTGAVAPRWQEADEAVQSLVDTLVAAATQTADHSGRKRPRGRARPERQPKGTRRHIAEVVRAHRLAPGLHVDRNTIAALLIGHRDLVTNPVLVVAVVQACGIITGRKLTAKKAARLHAASLHVAELIARAEADMSPVPSPRSATPPPPQPAPVEAALAPAVAEPSARLAAPDAASEPVPERRRKRARKQDRVRRRRAHRRRRWLLASAALLVLLVVVVALLTLG